MLIWFFGIILFTFTATVITYLILDFFNIKTDTLHAILIGLCFGILFSALTESPF